MSPALTLMRRTAASASSACATDASVTASSMRSSRSVRRSRRTCRAAPYAHALGRHARSRAAGGARAGADAGARRAQELLHPDRGIAPSASRQEQRQAQHVRCMGRRPEQRSAHGSGRALAAEQRAPVPAGRACTNAPILPMSGLVTILMRLATCPSSVRSRRAATTRASASLPSDSRNTCARYAPSAALQARALPPPCSIACAHAAPGREADA